MRQGEGGCWRTTGRAPLVAGAGLTTLGGWRGGGQEAIHAGPGCGDVPGFGGHEQRCYDKGQASEGTVDNSNDEWEVRWEASKGAMGSGNNKGEASKGATT